MGGISASKETFVESFIEIAGFKAGIVLTQSDLVNIFAGYGDLGYLLSPDGPEGFRLHSSEVEEATRHLLYSVGNIQSADPIPSHIRLFHKYKKDPGSFDIYLDVLDRFNRIFGREQGPPVHNGKVDTREFAHEVLDKHGKVGLSIALELLRGVNDDLHASPWGEMRVVQWKDRVELRALFEDESLETMHGQFFDQRFIDYIGQNFGEIGNIHWRKFEGLAGEFFTRLGFSVDMGPGRNDDGIDLRIYPEKPNEETPPLILVQCKRQKAKIDKALIKSVYADVLHEKATSGLIVTSSTLSPGAETLRTARGYPIEAADRATLEKWIQQMRSS